MAEISWNLEYLTQAALQAEALHMVWFYRNQGSIGPRSLHTEQFNEVMKPENYVILGKAG